MKIPEASLFFILHRKNKQKCMCDSDGRKENELLSNSKINKQFWKSEISMGKNLLIKITMGKSPNEMGNCPFAPPLATPLSSV